ncbi:MAG: AMP-binding protein [Raoultibacter sp.]
MIDEDRKRLYYEKGYWTPATIADVWDHQVIAHHDDEYVVDSRGHRYTYAQVDRDAAKLAAWLRVVGVEEGDVVSFQLPAWSEFCIVYIACLKAGAVINPLSMSLNARDLVYALNLTETAAFICPTFFHKTDYEAQIAEVASKIPSLKGVVLFDEMYPAKDNNLTWSALKSSYQPRNPPLEKTTSDSVALILFTSGTTDAPKAVLLTHNNILFSERGFVSALHLTSEDIMFMPAPLNHATGFNHGLIAPMILGGKVVVQEKFSGSSAIDLMNAEHATWSMGATPFIYDILSAIGETGNYPRDLRFYISGGAPVPGSMVQCASNNGIVLCECYGSTESCPHIVVPPEHALEWDGVCSGCAQEGIEVRVVDKAGNPVGPDVLGEELSRGPQVFVGYLHDDEEARRVLDTDGWFHSGDLCTQDTEGRIRIKGRIKEVIIRGGENVSASEVDECINDCPGVGAHATIGMSDKRLGERICTFLVPTDRTCPPALAEITTYLEGIGVRKRLWPEHIEYVDTIPRTESGKVRRGVLVDILSERMGKQTLNLT